jgi:beta-galactosidase
MVKTPFVLGTQYFRPPFPDARYWADDLRAMRDAGLNTVQVWLVWGWCEPHPGKYVFDDYDRLADLAARNGLGLMLSTLPEINPFWVPHVHPDALMVDVEGHTVQSCSRWECISGLVPGACSDHPDIRKRMVDFLAACGRHFGPREELRAWDCWNENRWRNMAMDLVCFCEHSLADQREFLRRKYGSLDGLGRAWGRRYADWSHVRVGRLYGYSYPEMRDFTHWLLHRAHEMARWRVEALKAADPRHPVSSHAGNPSIFGGQHLNENLFTRGIDWDVALGDTYGYSSFPSYFPTRMPPEEFLMRTSSLSTIGDGKAIWMSELQGGPSTLGRRWANPVSGAEQQCWIWTGISRGAKAALLWCWRPEVFGVETNALGFTAEDGFAEDRAGAMHRSAAVLDRKAGLIQTYRPDAPEVAVIFQRDSYFYGWINQKFHGEASNHTVENFIAYFTALERLRVPAVPYDDRHLPGEFGALRLAIVPDPLGLDDAAAQWLAQFARQGGTVFIEAAAGMHGPDTFMRYVNERPFYRAVGLMETVCRAVTQSRRTIPAGALGNSRPVSLLLDKLECGFQPGVQGVTPLDPDGFPMLANCPVGRGRVIALGSVVGRVMLAQAEPDFRALVLSAAALAGVRAPVPIRGDGSGFSACRLGRAGDQRILMVSNFAGTQKAALTLSASIMPDGAKVEEWFDHDFETSRAGDNVTLSLSLQEYDHAVFQWDAHTSST